MGAGSAGAALAARSAERGRTVLLLEAGPDYRSAEMDEIWRSPNPLRALLNPDLTRELVWTDLLARRTDVQEPSLYWRGRGVGGSSAINGQIAIRPPADDFDSWTAAGCTGWAWNDVLPIFCQIESDADYGHEPYHGSEGPIPVWRMPREHWGSVDKALADAALAMGFKWADDVNAPGASGVSPYPINSRASRRVSTNDAYLEPARNLANLQIRGHTLVDRVRVHHGRATAVEFIQDGRRQIEYAHEIVLAAGAIHTPAILLRSGIGRASALAQLNIAVVADLPVGEGLQDHPMFILPLPLRSEFGIETADDRHSNCCVRYASGDETGLFADMVIVAMNQNVLSMETANTAPAAGALGVWVNRCYARGTVGLQSRDPTVQPVIRERMLSDQRDLRRLRQGARLLAELCASEAIRQILRIPPDETGIDFHRATYGDDQELEAHLLATAVDTQHATSTCRMGPSGSRETVVDPDGRVLDVEALRVADASIFPTCPRANTNLASIVIGELIAYRLD